MPTPPPLRSMVRGFRVLFFLIRKRKQEYGEAHKLMGFFISNVVCYRLLLILYDEVRGFGEIKVGICKK